MKKNIAIALGCMMFFYFVSGYANQWIDIGNGLPTDSPHKITALTSFNGNVYAMGEYYPGSAFIFVYNNNDTDPNWKEIYQSDPAQTIYLTGFSMIHSKLYAVGYSVDQALSTMFLLTLANDQTWQTVQTNNQAKVTPFLEPIAFNDKIYVITTNPTGLYAYYPKQKTWHSVSHGLPSCDQRSTANCNDFYHMIVFNNTLYLGGRILMNGVRSQAVIYSYNGNDKSPLWHADEFPDSNYVNAFGILNNQLYAVGVYGFNQPIAAVQHEKTISYPWYDCTPNKTDHWWNDVSTGLMTSRTRQFRDGTVLAENVMIQSMLSNDNALYLAGYTLYSDSVAIPFIYKFTDPLGWELLSPAVLSFDMSYIDFSFDFRVITLLDNKAYTLGGTNRHLYMMSLST